MEQHERDAWLFTVFDIYIDAMLDGPSLKSEFFCAWYTELFNKGLRFSRES